MIVLLISAVAIIISIFLYYKNINRALLRIVAFIIFFIVITNVTLNVRSKEIVNPPAFLVDYSASMAKYVPNIAEEINKITFPHSLFFFSETLQEAKADEAIQKKVTGLGRFTDITSALSMVSRLNPSAIIVISDGNHNYGASPLSKVDELKAPVYCFGVGSTTQRDISIVDVLYPAYAFTGDSIKIEVVIESKEFTGGKGEIWLRSSPQKKGQKKSFFLGDVIAKNTVEFLIYATEPGLQKVHLYVTPQSGEDTQANNTYDFSIHILEKKIEVLYFTNHLSFNTKFILRVLGEDSHVELFPLIKTSEDRFLTLNNEKEEDIPPPLDEFDALILDNVNFSQLPWRSIEEFLNKGKGILCLGSIEGLTDTWRRILPIDITETVVKGHYPLKIIQPFSLLSIGDDYPPLSRINRIIGVKENGVIIAEADQFPIIAYRNYGKGLVFQMNAIDIGIWQFLQTGLKQEDLLSRLIGDIIRFISPVGQKGRLVLTSIHRDYVVGETIDLTLQSFDRDFRPAAGGDFYCDVENIKIPFFEIKEGTYEATFVAKKSGTFQIKATGKLGPETLNSKALKITVSRKAIETERGLNKQLLKTLAEITGGSYHSLEELEDFKLPPSEDRYISKQINFNSPISYFLIFILFAVDWLLRRKRGTI